MEKNKQRHPNRASLKNFFSLISAQRGQLDEGGGGTIGTLFTLMGR